MRVSDEYRERLRALVEGDEQIDHVDQRTGAALAAQTARTMTVTGYWAGDIGESGPRALAPPRPV
jgi:hypothetical protein